MIETTAERIKCECGNETASKFSIFVSKKRVLVNGRHSNESMRYIRCTVCSDMITQEEMNRQLEAPLVIDVNKRIKEGRKKKLTKK